MEQRPSQSSRRFVLATDGNAVYRLAGTVSLGRDRALSLRRARNTWLTAHLHAETPLLALNEIARPLSAVDAQRPARRRRAQPQPRAGSREGYAGMTRRRAELRRAEREAQRRCLTVSDAYRINEMRQLPTDHPSRGMRKHKNKPRRPRMTYPILTSPKQAWRYLRVIRASAEAQKVCRCTCAQHPGPQARLWPRGDPAGDVPRRGDQGPIPQKRPVQDHQRPRRHHLVSPRPVRQQNLQAGRLEAARVGELQRQVALGLQAPCAWAAAYPRTLLLRCRETGPASGADAVRPSLRRTDRRRPPRRRPPRRRPPRRRTQSERSRHRS